MSNIEVFGSAPSGLPARTSRALARQLAGIQASSAVQIARIEAAVQRHDTVMDGVTALTGRAQQHVVLVSGSEQQFALSCPTSSGRLALLGDQHALAMVAITMEARQALQRLA